MASSLNMVIKYLIVISIMTIFCFLNFYLHHLCLPSKLVQVHINDTGNLVKYYILLIIASKKETACKIAGLKFESRRLFTNSFQSFSFTTNSHLDFSHILRREHGG